MRLTPRIAKPAASMLTARRKAVKAVKSTRKARPQLTRTYGCAYGCALPVKPAPSRLAGGCSGLSCGSAPTAATYAATRAAPPPPRCRLPPAAPPSASTRRRRERGRGAGRGAGRERGRGRQRGYRGRGGGEGKRVSTSPREKGGVCLHPPGRRGACVLGQTLWLARMCGWLTDPRAGSHARRNPSGSSHHGSLCAERGSDAACP